MCDINGLHNVKDFEKDCTFVWNLVKLGQDVEAVLQRLREGEVPGKSELEENEEGRERGGEE